MTAPVLLRRIDDDRNMRRFYIVDENYNSEASAAEAMQRQAERKRRRGYLD